MFSMKKMLLGGLAIGGVAAAGYVAYKYYKTGTTGLFAVEQDDAHRSTEGKIISQQITCHQNESTDKNSDETARQVEKESKNVPPEEPKVEEDSSIESSMSAEEESEEEDDEMVAAPRRNLPLQHVRTLEQLDATLQALADYFFSQHRWQQDVRSAEHAFGWAWPLILEYRNRLPDSDSLDNSEFSSSSLEQGYENGIEDNMSS